MTAQTLDQPRIDRRPATLTAAILLLVLLGLSGPILLTGIDQIPPEARLAGAVLAVIKLAAAAGLWRRKRWAAILGFVAVLLDALSASPGLLDPPNTASVLYIVVGIGLSIATLVLLACRPSRRAYA